ncbi:MAG: LacI family DNA-binding transcriptional regulator [Chthonomonadales bacterium]|nr:LacI family DNA-binding transcriptional regulator [Chthonomonadales bacterium]
MMVHKWEHIGAAIRTDICAGRLRPGDRVASERELALAWRVSRMTVHRALVELQRAGWVQRQRGHGTVVASPDARRARRLAIVYHNDGNPLEGGYVRGVRSAVPEELPLLLCDSRNDPRCEARTIQRLAREVDGLIIVPTCAPENTAALRRAVDAGIALVCVDRCPDGLDVDAVVTDNYGCTLDALRYVITRGRGPIAHFTADNLHILAARERYDAYLQACREAGQDDPSHLVRRYPLSAIADRSLIRQLVADALAAMLHSCDPPGAAFCMNDFLLGPLLDACDDLGVATPGDLEIVSFNDAFVLIGRHESGVHRIVQQTRHIGHMAAEVLLERLCAPDQPCRIVRVPARFYPAGAPQTDRPGTTH